jgi:hypothetical protein
VNQYEARVSLLVPAITQEQRNRLAAALYDDTVRDCRSAVDVVEKTQECTVLLRLVVHAETAAAGKVMATELVDRALREHGGLLPAVLSDISLCAEEWAPQPRKSALAVKS